MSFGLRCGQTLDKAMQAVALCFCRRQFSPQLSCFHLSLPPGFSLSLKFCSCIKDRHRMGVRLL
ncbi:hypothetical protein D3P06_16200 [Paracoccus aestuarii]|uniref:Uncharacterized protein n=1 Tax=Paracoccus aestuarii TaxID=453842 RepID=A0A418ZQH0_9RHOB|nr:hypothetical protein D3P06_16200 [Paracoccus aestuarii]